MVNQPQPPLLEVQDLKKYFSSHRGFIKRQLVTVKAVDGVNLQVQAGETLGIVGESGSGKTTLGRCITRLYEPTGGKVFLNDESGRVSVTELEGDDLKKFRRKAQTIFQDPYSSLNPRMNVLQTVGEPLLVNNLAKGKELEERVTETILQVGLRVEHLQRYPHSFSGGQRQRIGIARALAINPELIICDEPISSLDVSIQAQVVNLLEELQDKLGLTYIFIAHDLSMVRHISDRMAVMYLGKVMELADRNEIYMRPMHPYTQALMSAVPVPDPARARNRQRILLEGDIPSPVNPPVGCHFNTRCPWTDEHCRQVDPEYREIVPGHFVACHYARVG